MDTLRICKQCNRPLPVDAPEGLCPACLAAAALDTQAPGSPATLPPSPSTSGKDPQPPSVKEIAASFPQLEILELLGQGGMGIVYKARQIKLDRPVALKILTRETAGTPGFADRFAREARLLARLSHPNIVGVYDFGETNGLYYLLMEYVPGLNLRQLQSSERLSPTQALAIVPKICDALQYAHEQGVVHRDIKPANILINDRGHVKIADFGLAKLLGKPAEDTTLTGAHHVMGTPHYMAPEQIEHPQDVDHRADIYSLGVVFYEMLTGELPVGRFEPPSARTRDMQVDVRLDEIVLRALDKQPERRYQQASEVRTDVERISASPTPPPVQQEAKPDPKESPEAPPLKPASQVQAVSVALLVGGILRVATVILPGMSLALWGGFRGWSLLESVPSPDWGVFGPGFGPLIPLCAGALMIVGSQQLKAIRSYPWSLAGAIASLMPIGDLWLIYAGIGGWALVIMHRTHVKEAFEQGSPPGEGSRARLQRRGRSDRRLSIKALIGSILVLPLLAACLESIPPLARLDAGSRPLDLMPVVVGPGALSSLARWTPALMMVTGGTLFGFLAIGDIRRSGGRMWGAPLAVFAALLLPLLLLDSFLVFAWRSMGHTVLGGMRSLEWSPTSWAGDPLELLIPLCTLLTVVLVDVWIITATYRATRPQ